jgi:enoyl-CoA hydratase/carnithine racemase
MTASAELVQERRGAVLVLRLNRPDARNALTLTLMRDLAAAVAAAESDTEVRAIVLTGTGPRAFCAGMDLRAFAEADLDLETRAGADIDAYMRLPEGEVTIPVVGAANASAVAGGFELLLGCDLVVASSEATFGLPEVKRGLFAGSGVMHIGKRLPLAVALELSLTGDAIDARRAYDLGLVNVVVPPEDVFATALAVAERIVANGPLAVAATKELVRAAADNAPNARDRLLELQALVFGSDDAKEGARAFVEKRAPVWQGK